ncbi:MAG: hypothetical protein AB7S94_04420 [Simkaniaceae bacterium]
MCPFCGFYGGRSVISEEQE